MQSPNNPSPCRHDYLWSDVHQAELCRHCGKGKAAAVAPAMALPAEDGFLEIPVFNDPLPPRRAAAGDKVLKAQALLRRDALLTLLERLAEDRPPSREDAIDAVLAVIEDAHSADPVLFGEAAARHFARLHEARTGLVF
ncbi:hypothetical protein [Brevundimonas sp.]|uniref:hypothetical protein n=1 Tax=Brevundimonas sp. TaxID=1871086 RepID=UPI0025B994D5|nr:hypothetical protein [Brevundimonas sp.]